MTTNDNLPSSPEFDAARAAHLAGFGRDRLTLLRWAHAIATGSEALELLAAPIPEGDDHYYAVARAGAAELAVLIGSLCEAQGADVDEFLAQQIVVQTLVNTS